jgi:CHAT domain-containing protein
LAARALEGLFEASAGEGELESSLDTARRAIASVEGVRARLLSADQRMGFLARRATLYRRAAAVALALKRAAEAAQLAELGRARAHLDLLTETQAGLDIALSGTGRAEEQRLRRELEDAEGRMTPGNRAAAEEARQAYARYDSFLKKIERQQTDEEKLPLGRPATLAQIQAVLPASTALLHYTLLEQDAFLLVITSHTIEPVRLGPAAPLNADVNRLREWLAKRPSQLGQLPFLELSHSLYRRLVAPATTLLGGRRRLIVIPDGILHYLPFQVLTSAPASSVAQAPFLIRTYSIHYAPSASVLVELRQWQRQREPAQLLLAIGDPDYAGRYPRLTFSAQEVNGIARLYPAASRTVLLHSAAREDSLASAGDLSRYRILHFAVHGYLNEQMPNFSGLVMTQSKGSDGVLRVHEILRRNLQADLVVLSACETALGRQVNGEGLLGLTRAFLARGSRSVVASLWRVDDQSTAALMTVYHQKLRGGRLDRAEALRQAQLAMLDGSTAHPFYWAGFVFSGGAD